MKCRVQFTRVMIDEDADDYLDALIVWIFRLQSEILVSILMEINLT